MDTNEIDIYADKDKWLRNIYGGTCSIDNVPDWSSTRCCYIINLSPSWHPGSHWVAAYKDDETAEYFCSYGTKASSELKWLLGRKYSENSKQLQTLTSDLCGQYCLFYLMCRARGLSLNDVLSCFSNNCTVNDCIVCHVVCA